MSAARCRVSVDLAKRHRLQINSIVRVQLLPSRQEVLCTVWPDTYQVLGPVPSSSSPTGEGQPVHDMCIDDSITKGPNAGDDRLCQVSAAPPARTVHIVPRLHILGLPDIGCVSPAECVLLLPGPFPPLCRPDRGERAGDRVRGGDGQ